MTKLPVLQTVRETWAFIWQERRDLFYLAAPFVVVLSIINALMAWLTPQAVGLTDQTEEVSSAVLLTIPIQIVVGLLVTTLFSVTWHRRYLVPQESITVAATLNWSQRHWHFLRAMLVLIGIYIALSIALAVVMSVVMLPLILLSGAAAETAQLPLFLAIGLPVLIYCLVRLSLLFPAAAVDEHLSVKACWHRTRGNGWRIFFAYFLASLPLFLLVTAISLVIGAVLPTPAPSLTVLFLSGLIQQMLFYVSFAVGISVLSRVYRTLTDSGGASAVSTIPS